MQRERLRREPGHLAGRSGYLALILLAGCGELEPKFAAPEQVQRCVWEQVHEPDLNPAQSGPHHVMTLEDTGERERCDRFELIVRKRYGEMKDDPVDAIVQRTFGEGLYQVRLGSCQTGAPIGELYSNWTRPETLRFVLDLTGIAGDPIMLCVVKNEVDVCPVRPSWWVSDLLEVHRRNVPAATMEARDQAPDEEPMLALSTLRTPSGAIAHTCEGDPPCPLGRVFENYTWAGQRVLFFCRSDMESTTYAEPSLGLRRIAGGGAIDDFWLAQNETSRLLWYRVTGKSGPWSSPDACDDGWERAACDSCAQTSVSLSATLSFLNELSVAAGLEHCYDLTGCTDAEAHAQQCQVRVTSASGDPRDCAGYRLPTREEWLHAAEPVETRRGWVPAEKQVYCNGVGAECSCVEAGEALRANLHGLYRMAGNVGEWVFGSDAPCPVGEGEVMGGSHLTVVGEHIDLTVPRCLARCPESGCAAADVGFRIARSLRPWERDQ